MGQRILNIACLPSYKQYNATIRKCWLHTQQMMGPAFCLCIARPTEKKKPALYSFFFVVCIMVCMYLNLRNVLCARNTILFETGLLSRRKLGWGYELIMSTCPSGKQVIFLFSAFRFFLLSHSQTKHSHYVKTCAKVFYFHKETCPTLLLFYRCWHWDIYQRPGAIAGKQLKPTFAF